MNNFLIISFFAKSDMIGMAGKSVEFGNDIAWKFPSLPGKFFVLKLNKYFVLGGIVPNVAILCRNFAVNF